MSQEVLNQKQMDRTNKVIFPGAGSVLGLAQVDVKNLRLSPDAARKAASLVTLFGIVSQLATACVSQDSPTPAEILTSPTIVGPLTPTFTPVPSEKTVIAPTPIPKATATLTPKPTETPTLKPQPPTETPTPTEPPPTVTATPQPTETMTPIPPTATATVVKPTNTPKPPEATATKAAPTATRELLPPAQIEITENGGTRKIKLMGEQWTQGEINLLNARLNWIQANDPALYKKIFDYVAIRKGNRETSWLPNTCPGTACSGFTSDGKIFENYFISLTDWRYFYRDPLKHDVDFVSLDENKNILPIEAKFKKEIRKEELLKSGT